MSILVIGQGKVEDQNVYRTGSIRLVVVDFDQPKVSILAMPAELYVDAKVLKDTTIPFDKLDFIYHETFLNAGNVPEDVAHVKGTQATAQAIVDNFGFVPDHYVTVLQEPFVELVDTLGGIKVVLPTALPSKDPDYDFPKGEQTLSGTQTLNLTRYDPDGQPNDVWGRFEHQDIVLQGLLAAIKEPANWTKAPDLLKLARKMILTDLSVDQLNDLKCMVEQAGSQATQLEVSEDMVTVDSEGHWNPNFQAVKDRIQQMYAQ
jgi:LCP family protein required for cell wall assembly